MEGGSVRHNFERNPPKDHPCQVWFNLVPGFRGEDLNVKAYDVRRTPGDGKSSHGLLPGELKRGTKTYDIGNPGSGLEQAQKCGVINEIPTLPS
jgi:hypothetical protein